MQKKLSTALLAMVFAAVISGGVSAQAAPSSATAKSSHPSVDWAIGDLLADPGAKAVLDKDLPNMSSDPRLDMVRSMSLRTVAQFPEAQIDDAKLSAIQADLAALPKHSS
jgi:hypothetical protein